MKQHLQWNIFHRHIAMALERTVLNLKYQEVGIFKSAV